MKKSTLVVTLCSLLCSSYAAAKHPVFYVSADAGITQASYDTAYRDQTDVIPQNISITSQQHGYTGGLAIGISQLIYTNYFVGGELSGHLNTSNARFESGAATAAFSDNTQINRYLDLTVVPGIFLSPSVAAYIKLGISYASLQDNLTSPTGFTPTMTAFNSNSNAVGFAGGLGLEKVVSDHVSVFVEGTYHDYGVVNFANFTNFSANYTHNARVYSYAATLGVSLFV